MRIDLRRIAPFAFLGVLAGCALLPRSGPYRSDLVATSEDQNRVAVVNIDPSTVSLLAATPAPSLRGTFGDTQPARDQRVGVGDSVEITLWEASGGGLFSSPVVDRTSSGSRSAVIPPQVVAHDGAITVPFAGRIEVIGRTPPEIESEIVGRLKDKAIDPQALVTVTKNVSNTVTVMGEVGPGARVPLSVRGDRLLEVIAESGGVRAPVSDTSVVLARGGRIARVPMEAVLNDPSQDIFMQPDDVVTLVRDPQSFTAVGATGRNGVVPFDMVNLTLDQAMAKAGGLLDDRADPAGLFVIRFEEPQIAAEIPAARGVPAQTGGVPVVYHLDLRDQSALFMARRFPIRNKDILYVSNAPLSDIQKVLTLVNLLVTPAVTGITVNSAVR